MRFSIIIPAYNSENTICDALDSILDQTIEDYEIIVIDDGSKVHVSDVLKEYISDTRLQIVRQKNAGVAAARNKGISLAKGEYICFLDADDIWYSNHLQTIEEMKNEFGALPMFITSHIVKLPSGENKYSAEKMVDYPKQYVCKNLFDLLLNYSGGIVNTNCVCIRKNVLECENLRFVPGAIRGEDTDLWFRVALKNVIGFSKSATTVYQREYSTATKETSFIHSWVFAQRLPCIEKDASIQPNVKKSCRRYVDRYWMKAARVSKMEGDLLRAIRYLTKVTYWLEKRFWISVFFICMPRYICRKIANKYERR